MLNIIEDKVMVMQINDTAKLKSRDLDSRLKANLPEVKNAGKSNTVVPDKVNISSTSKQLEALKALLNDTPIVNSALVSRFKAEILAGTYEINDYKIAQNLLNNNLEMA